MSTDMLRRLTNCRLLILLLLDSYLLQCTPLSSKTPTRLQPVGSLKVGRYISEIFEHSLQGIYTRAACIIYPVDYVKTYSSSPSLRSLMLCSTG